MYNIVLGSINIGFRFRSKRNKKVFIFLLEPPDHIVHIVLSYAKLLTTTTSIRKIGSEVCNGLTRFVLYN